MKNMSRHSTTNILPFESMLSLFSGPWRVGEVDFLEFGLDNGFGAFSPSKQVDVLSIDD